ncbi:hypothetical protein [Sphingomonas mesophila]|uniref:hypothetical protein n=1 Tax=Sphingomonas mesophila TaxID=2303576 RepID=UPI0013C319CD|nr:hypothetical protein [Sphingomonas mesophila]
MTKRPNAAGGFLLILPIVAGFGYGLSAGRTMEWTVAGLGVGIVLALAVWLIDRRR